MPVSLAYLGVVLIWATTPLTVKWSSVGVTFWFGVLSRMMIGTLLCLLLIKLLHIELPWNKAAILKYGAAAIGIFAAMSCVYFGAQFIPSGLIAVMFGLVPLVTGFLAQMLLREKGLTGPEIIGALLGIVGLSIIFRDQLNIQPDSWLGLVAVLVGVFLHSLSMVMVKQNNFSLHPLAVTTGGLMLSTILYILVWLVFDQQIPSDIPVRTAFSILYLGVFGSVLGFILFFFVLERLETSKTALITLITPVLALLVGWQFNHERLQFDIFAGTGCILAGLVLHQWGHRLLPRKAVEIKPENRADS